MARATPMDFHGAEQYVTDQLVDALAFQEHPAYATLSCRRAMECIVQYQYQIENQKFGWNASEYTNIISILHECREIRPQIKEVIESINAQTRGEMHFNRDRLGDSSAKTEDIEPIVSMVKHVFQDLFQKEIETSGLFKDDDETLTRIHRTIVASIDEKSGELNYNQLILSAAVFAQEKGANFSEFESILSEIDRNVKILEEKKIAMIEREIETISKQNEIILKLLTKENVQEEELAVDDDLEKLFEILDNQRKPPRDDTFFDMAAVTEVMMDPHDYESGIYIKPTGNAAEPLLIHLGLLKCIRDSEHNELIRMASSYNLLPQQSIDNEQVSLQQPRNLKTLLIWHLILDDMDLSTKTLINLPKQSIHNLCVIFLLPTLESKEENISQLTELLIQATQK